MMVLRDLGNTGIRVSPVGLGCWQFSKRANMAGKFWPSVEDGEIEKIVSASLKAGINFFDTAEAYGNGTSEKSLSASLRKAGVSPEEVVVATKWWPGLRFASDIKKSINNRIQALEPFPVDLYQIHQPYGLSGEKKEMAAMASLLEKGMIRSIGVSNFSAGRMQNAWEFLQKKGLRLASNQVRYNLLDRRIESNGVTDTAKKLGISIIAYSPLAQGIITGKFHDNPELVKNTGMRKYTANFRHEGLERSRPLVMLLKDMAAKYNVTPSQIAINWLINYHGDLVIAIPGVTMEKQARENAHSMHFRISDEDMQKIDRESSIFK
jgi:aryl-alcohol dehydrogenase-like predicted oxidoreductase